LYQQRCEIKEKFTSFDSTLNMTQNDLKNKIKQLENKLHVSQLDTERCKTELAHAQSQGPSSALIDALASTAASRIQGPERIYPHGNLYDRQPSYDYQMVGFLISEDGERLALYGRPKYRSRTDKMEYYAVDDTRNHLKIPFETRGDEEISDGDTVNIERLGKQFVATIYEYKDFRYIG